MWISVNSPGIILSKGGGATAWLLDLHNLSLSMIPAIFLKDPDFPRQSSRVLIAAPRNRGSIFGLFLL